MVVAPQGLSCTEAGFQSLPEMLSKKLLDAFSKTFRSFLKHLPISSQSSRQVLVNKSGLD
jgi:hypothetical protein